MNLICPEQKEWENAGKSDFLPANLIDCRDVGDEQVYCLMRDDKDFGAE